MAQPILDGDEIIVGSSAPNTRIQRRARLYDRAAASWSPAPTQGVGGKRAPSERTPKGPEAQFVHVVRRVLRSEHFGWGM